MPTSHSKNKKKKTLHLPQWICQVLDSEGQLLGGRPGMVAAAALLMFAEAEPAHKAAYLRRIHEQEVAEAYDLCNQNRGGVESSQKIARRIVKNSNPSEAKDTHE